MLQNLIVYNAKHNINIANPSRSCLFIIIAAVPNFRAVFSTLGLQNITINLNHAAHSFEHERWFGSTKFICHLSIYTENFKYHYRTYHTGQHKCFPIP